MQALVLAGGKGTRLRPYTTVLPKPLMPVGDYPVLEILFRQLRQAEVRHVILAIGYMSHLFEALFETGSRLGLEISYSVETEELGTAGPISLVFDRLEDDFLVLNGDLLTTLDFGRFFSFHKENKAAATIGVYRREVKIDFGVLETGEADSLLGYTEKPVFQFDVSMGVNALNKERVRPYLTVGKRLDIPDLMMALVKDGHPVRCYREPCFWLDIGRVEDYQNALEIFDSRSSEFLPKLK